MPTNDKSPFSLLSARRGTRPRSRLTRGALALGLAFLAGQGVFLAWLRPLPGPAALAYGVFLLVFLVGAARLRRTLLTERRGLEATLRKISTAVERNPAAIIMTDPTGAVTYVNPKFTEMTGYSPTELLGQNLRLLKSGELPAEVYQNLWRTIAAGHTWQGEFHNRKKNGELFWDHTTIAPVRDAQGRVTSFVAIKEDINERKRAEQERASLMEQLAQSQKMESLGSLAGGVAHDINNVLGAILGLASAHLGTLPADDPLHQTFDLITQAAVRGGRTVRGLLGLARRAPAEERDLDLNELLREETLLLERTTLARIRVALDLAEDLLPVRGDASALSHAFLNLCLNAVEAMPDQGTLTLATRNLGQDWVEVLVQDTGQGMSSAVRSRALDPFFTTKEVGKGTGLGLALVYSTMKAHQGHLDLESEPGQGTRVRLRFPASLAKAPDPGPFTEPSLKPTHGALRILLVDDDDLVTRSTSMLLAALGFRTEAAANGEAALAKIASGFQPDVVILDMNMPGLGGKGTLPLLRDLCPEVPVLLATGRLDDEAIALVAAHPRVALLPKPFTAEELLQHLQ